jgi:hypothetical protein
MQSARFETASTFSIATQDAPVTAKTANESTTDTSNLRQPATDLSRHAPRLAHPSSFKPPSLGTPLG